ncbi:IS3 family transposase [Williamsoniiplasma lucivorax]|uniref:Transposase n=2 Tax=Williamsoniiplasma lucivorax TaxID=209274 RepID=A0A2S5REP6_9MOLU|nr:IS3 family transposase [Williamsoniiplasma lucivorax]PPE05799.1 transposase [Williamsoniiplasma lucivorax]
MPKQLTKQQWINVIEIYKKQGISDAVKSYLKIRKHNPNLKELRRWIRKKAKLLDNLGMEAFKSKKGSGRLNKRDDSDIPQIINDLTEEQKNEILEHWIKEQRNKKEKENLNTFDTLTKPLKAKILGMHRTTMYKKAVARKYKFDYLRGKVTDIFNKNNKIFGSKRITAELAEEGIIIDERTLRNYMVRWNLVCLTRQKKKKMENKNTDVKFEDLVRRNFNPEEDNIIATDVSYIPADAPENFVYLSVTISHKTKMIESWKLSQSNNTQLVLDTINGLKRKNFIFHSDHGFQYSSYKVLDKLKTINAKTSMGRVGNSLDNREVEYFFGCLKGEYLNHLATAKMKFNEIHKYISEYIEWYNFKRKQKVLNWKTPASASAINS